MLYLLTVISWTWHKLQTIILLNGYYRRDPPATRLGSSGVGLPPPAPPSSVPSGRSTHHISSFLLILLDCGLSIMSIHFNLHFISSLVFFKIINWKMLIDNVAGLTYKAIMDINKLNVIVKRARDCKSISESIITSLLSTFIYSKHTNYLPHHHYLSMKSDP